MDRKSVFVIAAAILAASVIIGLSPTWAQHGFRTDHLAEGTVGRYVVVSVTDAEVIIMDTASGDLYSAKPKDVKPHEARPRPKSFASARFSTTTERPRPPTTDAVTVKPAPPIRPPTTKPATTELTK